VLNIAVNIIGTTGKLYHPMFLSSDHYQMPTYPVPHVLCYISVSISGLPKRWRNRWNTRNSRHSNTV